MDEEIKKEQRVLYRCNHRLHGLEVLTRDGTLLRTNWLDAREVKDPSNVSMVAEDVSREIKYLLS